MAVSDPMPLKPVAYATGLASMMSSVGYPTDDGTGPDPDGPLGPYIHRIISTLGVLVAAARLEDGPRRQIQVAAARELVRLSNEFPGLVER